MPDHVDQMIQFAGCVAAYFGDPTNPAGQAELSLWLARVLGRSTVHWRLEMERATDRAARLDLQAAQQQLAYLWKSTGSCPCGARRGEAHVIGCPTAAALKETP